MTMPDADSTQPVGPIFTGGFQSTTVSHDGVDYDLLYLPDKHNDTMQAAGKPPVYYWLPAGVRLAEKPNGDLKFYFLHFAGVQTGSTTVGVIPGETREITGGALSFTITSAPPDGVLAKMHDQILGTWKDKGDRFTMFRSNAPKPTLGDPAYLRPMTVASNTISVSNASLNPDQSLTAGGGVDPFFWKMQGQGPGATNPLAENSFTCMMGSTAAEIVAAGFKANQSIITVVENRQMPLWAPVTSLSMSCDWQRCFDHFSADVNAHYFWASADVKATFNDLRMSGAITVKLEIDATLPGADTAEALVDKYIDMIIPMWLDQAKQTIFAPMPQIPDAQAPSTSGGGLFGWGFGAGVALQYRHDQVSINESFEFDIDRRYLQPDTIGGSLDGLADLLKKNPDQLRKYFGELYLDDFDRMITVACKPDVNWDNPSQSWVGDPVDYVAVEVGYPTTAGALEWQGNTFSPPLDPADVVPTDPQAGLPVEATPGASSPAATTAAYITFASGTTSEIWYARMTQKLALDVAAPPKDWQPDKMYVKRALVFKSALPDTASPYVRQRVEVDRVDLDGTDNGQLTNDLSQPIKVDHVGTMNLGPILIDGHLSGNWTLDLALKPRGNRLDGTSREGDVVTFNYSATDQLTPRYWTIYTGQRDYTPDFQYQVTVNRNADIGDAAPPNDGWVGPWTQASASGAFSARVPRVGQDGVVEINPQPGT
jgi:hypothetical protein